MMPEQKLFQSVIIKALDDATLVDPASQEDRAEKRAADAWIRRAGKHFRFICSLAGFDPDFISEQYIAGNIDGELLRRKAPRPDPGYDRVSPPGTA